MDAEFEISLEEIVSLMRTPPLVRRIFDGELVLVPSDVEKFNLLKKSYDNSFKKIISSKSPNSYLEFRHFLRRYDYFFGENLFKFLDNLGNKSIDYVIGSIQFEENLKNHRHFVPKVIPEYTH